MFFFRFAFHHFCAYIFRSPSGRAAALLNFDPNARGSEIGRSTGGSNSDAQEVARVQKKLTHSDQPARSVPFLSQVRRLSGMSKWEASRSRPLMGVCRLQAVARRKHAKQATLDRILSAKKTQPPPPQFGNAPSSPSSTAAAGGDIWETSNSTYGSNGYPQPSSLSSRAPPPVQVRKSNLPMPKTPSFGWSSAAPSTKGALSSQPVALASTPTTSSFRLSTSSYGPPPSARAGAGGTSGMGSMQQLMRTQAVTMTTEEAATVLQCAYRKTVAERRVLEKLLDLLGSDGQGGESSAVVSFEE